MEIQVKVRPNCKIQEVSRTGDIFIVRVKEPAKEGKANRAVIQLLAEHFGVPRSHVRILRGFTSRNKVIDVTEE